MARVLVTGGAGYIGSNVAAALIKAKHTVVIYDDLSTGNLKAVPEEAIFVFGSVLDVDLLTVTFNKYNIDAVVHLAAKLIVSESISRPLEYYNSNVCGMICLLEACQSSNISRVLFSSTAAVYGAHEYASEGVTEEDFCRPINPYGSSKLMAETILKESSSVLGLDYIVFRYFNVAGASVDGLYGPMARNSTHLIKVLCEVALEKRGHVDIFGSDYQTPDGSCIRDYIHIADLADLHVLGLERILCHKVREVFNCGYGQGYSVFEVLKSMERVAGREVRHNIVERRAGDSPVLVANVTRLCAALGWAPKYNDIQFICSSALNWEKRLP